ncbi:MAG: hypothetical protein FWG39_00395 [Alphaproteobacteria bacterium]|nr:hypothetical protein [Alphaproteobacteria bacterium]
MKQLSILSRYDAAAPALELLKTPNSPRRNGLIELYQTGLPSNNAVLFEHSDSPGLVREKIENFCRAEISMKSIVATVRYDGGPGGNGKSSGVSHKLNNPDAMEKEVSSGLSDGFLPMLAGFANNHRAETQAAACVRVIGKNQISIEMLGPGYNASVLTKGQVPPALRLDMKPNSPDITDLAKNASPEHLILRFYVYNEAALLSPEVLAATRAERALILLGLLAKMNKRSPEEEEAWLRDNGFADFIDKNLVVSMSDITTIFGFAARLRTYLDTGGKRPQEIFAFSTLKLPHGKWALDNLYGPDKFIAQKQR